MGIYILAVGLLLYPVASTFLGLNTMIIGSIVIGIGGMLILFKK